MKLSKPRAWHFWSAESGLTGLLIFTVIYLLVVCSLSDFISGVLVADLLFSLMIVSGVLATFQRRWLGSLAVFLAVASLTLTWVQNLHPEVGLMILNTVLKLIFLGFLLAVLAVQVFGAGAVTAHRIRGAMVVYLLLGGGWSLLYYVAALSLPNAFHFPDGLVVSDPHALQRTLTYFSFTTLTTTGLGDITPTNSVTRTLTMFEALTGQLYLVITLARLVSLAVRSPDEGAP